MTEPKEQAVPVVGVEGGSLADARPHRATEQPVVGLRAALEEIRDLEPRPFDGGLDMEAIRACPECRRYTGHPVQQGICNTHRQPMYARERHESHEEKALGYRAKSIARDALSQDESRKLGGYEAEGGVNHLQAQLKAAYEALEEIHDGMVAARKEISVEDWIETARQALARRGEG